MDKHRSKPQYTEPKGKPDGSSQGVGSAQAEPPLNTTQNQKAGSAQAEPLFETHKHMRGEGTVKTVPPSFISGFRTAETTLKSTNTHTHAGGPSKAGPPHTTKGKTVTGGGKTSVLADSKPATSATQTSLTLPHGGVELPSNTQPTQIDEGWTMVTHKRSKVQTVTRRAPENSAERTQEPAPKEQGSKKNRRSKLQRQRDKRAALRTTAAGPEQPADNRAREGKNPKVQTTAKRVRLDDTLSPRGQPKKPRFERKGEPRPNFAEALQSDLMVAVTTETIGHLTPQQAQEVQDRLNGMLMQQAMEPSKDPAGPVFRGKPIHTDGALKLRCANQQTLTWLHQCLKDTTLESGEKLVVVKQSELTRKVRCGILLPGVWEEMGPVGRTLRYQNPWAQVQRWLLHKADKQQTDTFVIVRIPEDVVQLLLTHKRELGFLLGSVYVKFQGPKGKFYETPPTPRKDIPEAATEPSGTDSGSPRQQPQTASCSEGQGVNEDAILESSEDGEDCAQGLGNLALGEDEEDHLSKDDGVPFPTM